MRCSVFVDGHAYSLVQLSTQCYVHTCDVYACMCVFVFVCVCMCVCVTLTAVNILPVSHCRLSCYTW